MYVCVYVCRYVCMQACIYMAAVVLLLHNYYPLYTAEQVRNSAVSSEYLLKY